jgi:hypothetical protein
VALVSHRRHEEATLRLFKRLVHLSQSGVDHVEQGTVVIRAQLLLQSPVDLVVWNLFTTGHVRVDRLGPHSLRLLPRSQPLASRCDTRRDGCDHGLVGLKAQDL